MFLPAAIASAPADTPPSAADAAIATLASPALRRDTEGQIASTGGSPGDSLRVFLMTMGPGPAVWERFGHNAIWIHDPVAGTDRAYNYGLFSFAQEGFIRRFIKGRMEYWMGYDDAYLTVEAYRRAGRSVWVQELNLTPEQKVELRDFLEWNALPENTFYRYDYYRDNCSTRVRDAIDRVLDGRLKSTTTGVMTGTTYRSHTRQLTGSDYPIYAGLLLAMGHPVDAELSVWEEMFLPMKLMEHVRSATVVDAEGREAPLVIAEQPLFLAADGDDPERGPPLVAFLMIGLVVGGMLAGAGAAARRSRVGEIAFVALAGVWMLVVGVLGAVISGLWLFTDHYVAFRNENVLQVHPVWLVTGALVLAGGFGIARAAQLARGLTLVLAALAVAGVILQIVPALDQANGEILALMVPATLGLAWGIAQWSRTSVANSGRAR